ncbi:MAG TPA: response regulator transcription factor [Aequorivita sp.]|nr:response regulator transcription factor [Aequorivita sp.]
MAIKILLYEDNFELRDSLSSFIEFVEDFELLAAFENCSNIANHLETYSPDIVLMDIDMPIVNGIEGLKILRSLRPNLPVIMLTVFEDNKYILSAIKEGATGYILKQHITSRLEVAIKEAISGGAPMSPIVARLVLKHLSNSPENKIDYALTKREKEILQSLTDGNSYKMIAANEGISIGTVSTHIKNIYEKLGVHSQAEAVGKTLREGIL